MGEPIYRPPKVIHADFGLQFRSADWKTYFQMSNIKRHTSGVESRNALGVGERYHKYHRQIYRRVQIEHKNIGVDYVLFLSVHATNCTARKNGLSTCLLVFGILPNILSERREFPEQKKRMKALQTARSAMVEIIARLI